MSTNRTSFWTRVARPMPSRLAACVVGIGVGALGCGQSQSSGLDEPIRVLGGQFFEGELPGSPPLTSQGATPETPTVTSVDGASGVVRRGDDRSLRGRVSGDAHAVAVRFANLGTGYWVVPVGSPDAAFPGEFSFHMSAELSRSLPPGSHDLLFAAIGEGERSGTQRRVGLCVPQPFPDNLNACDPRREPPNLVVTLAWDVDADVDLQVLTPAGVLVDAKNPRTAGADAEESVGMLDQDAGAGCALDGLRRESLVFTEPPPPGEYRVYANLFDPCRQRVARFTAAIYTAEAGDEPDTFRQVERFRSSGELLSVQANGGKQIGLFVTKFTVE